MNPDAPRPSRESARILLVEDDLDQAHLFKVLLEEGLSCTVTLAQDGVRGGQLAGDFDWDLVIADINLPGMDGIRVMEASKTRHPDTPVLATTAYTDPHYRANALRMGADDLIMKPVDRDELLERVRGLLRSDGDDPTGRETLQVLAVGLRPGDVEAGCGGILVRHRERGDRVVAITLAGAEGDEAEARKEEAKRSSRKLGIRLFVGHTDDDAGSVADRIGAFVEGAAREFRPDVVYLHTPHVEHPMHRAGYQATLSVTTRAPNVYCFETGASTVRFRPSVFVDISDQLQQKLAALEEYRSHRAWIPHLAPDFAAASARYWGRFTDWGSAEALEVVRGSRDVPPGAVATRPLGRTSGAEEAGAAPDAGGSEG